MTEERPGPKHHETPLEAGVRTKQLVSTKKVENDVLQTLKTAERHTLKAVLTRVVHTSEAQ